MRPKHVALIAALPESGRRRRRYLQRMGASIGASEFCLALRKLRRTEVLTTGQLKEVLLGLRQGDELYSRAAYRSQHVFFVKSFDDMVDAAGLGPAARYELGSQLLRRTHVPQNGSWVPNDDLAQALNDRYTRFSAEEFRWLIGDLMAQGGAT